MDALQVFTLSADHVVLDFINTLDERFAPPEVDKLACYADLVKFAEQTQMLTGAQAASLSRAARTGGNTEAALRAAIELRELLARIFYAIAAGERVAKRDLEAFNESLSEAAKHRVLFEQEDSFGWRWEGLDHDVEAPLWPVLQEAADLLVSPHLKFVRACARESCRWLFLDLSKNHSRRWCDMKVCGNRVKASRYYAVHGRE